VKAIRSQFIQIGLLLAALVIIHVVSMFTVLTQYGIVPRTVIGLRGIVFSPLLHGSWSHLLSNLPTLGVMLALLGLSKGRLMWPTTAMLWLASGALVWVLGRPGSIQVGASGLIYALAAFLITDAWATRHIRSAIIALAVVFFYGGIVWGLLPSQPGVSWEGHLCGAFAGFILAPASRRKKARPQAAVVPEVKREQTVDEVWK
jgi:membrane associated rhomboid family serine protease